MAIVKEIEIKVDAKQATKTLDELGGSFEDVYGEVQPLSGRIGELEDRLYEMALAGQKGTQEFKDLTAEVGKMKKVIVDTDMVVDGMSQTLSQSLGYSLGGITAAFELGTGAMGAMGVESEKVAEAILKVQGAMAIAQGVQGIREAIPAFNNLKNSIVSAASGLTTFQKALIATGLGAIVALVGTLAANWDKVTEFLGGATKAQKALKQSLEDVKGEITSVYEEVNKMGNTFKLAKDGVISKEDALKEYNETIGKTLGQAKSLEEAEKRFNDNTDTYIKAATLRAQAQQLIKMAAEEQTEALLASEEDNRAWYTQVAGFVNDAAAAFIDYSTLGLTNLSETSDQVNEYLKKSATEQLINEKNNNTKRYNELAASLQEELSLLEKNNNFINQEDIDLEKERERLAKEAAAKRKAEAEKAEAERKAAAEKAEADRLARIAQQAQEESDLITKITELEDEYLSSKLSKEQQEINAVKEKYFATIEAARLAGEETYLLEEAQQQAILDIQKRYAAEKAELDKKAEADKKQKTAEELQRETDLQSAKLDLAGATLQGIGSLVNAFAGENEEQQRRAFNISKAISIAQATIDTYKGATAAFASTAASPLGIANPAAPFIAAAAAVAAGLANVATIARQQYQGGGSGGAGGGAVASNPPAELSNPATFNVVGNTGTNQLAQTLGQQPLQAYVVAGDVTSAQSLERNKIQQSTL